MELLIVKLSSLGDVIQTMPVVHDLRSRFPLGAAGGLGEALGDTGGFSNIDIAHMEGAGQIPYPYDRCGHASGDIHGKRIAAPASFTAPITW